MSDRDSTIQCTLITQFIFKLSHICEIYYKPVFTTHSLKENIEMVQVSHKMYVDI